MTLVSFLLRYIYVGPSTPSDLVKNGSSIILGEGNIFNDFSRCMLWIVVIALTTTFLWRRYYEYARDHDNKLPLPPGCMGFPLVGETLSLIFFGAEYYRSRRERYGNIYKTHVLGQPTIRVTGAENIRAILMGEHITVESSWPKSTKLLMGPGSLLNACPDSHRIRKKILIQALSPPVVAAHISEIQETVRQHVLDWCNKGELVGSDICRQLSMSLATRILIGFHMNNDGLKAITDDFRKFLSNLFALPWKFPGSGLSRGLKAREKIIAEIKKRLLTETSYWSLVDELKKLDHTAAFLTVEEMADAVLELWFAGNDTSASTMCSALLALGRDTRVCGKIEDELRQHGLMNSDTHLTKDNLTKLTYTDGVIKEVLRIYPPAGGGFRRAKKTLELGGYQIPKGWKIIYSIRDTHQTTELFDNKETFIPERWLEMDEKTQEIRQKFHYVPFGAGLRACPGEKFVKTVLKTFVVELIRTCTWKLKNKTPRILYIPTTHPADRLPVTFTLNKEGARA